MQTTNRTVDLRDHQDVIDEAAKRLASGEADDSVLKALFCYAYRQALLDVRQVGLRLERIEDGVIYGAMASGSKDAMNECRPVSASMVGDTLVWNFTTDFVGEGYMAMADSLVKGG